MRKALVTSSLGIHIGVAFGLFVAGVWKIERLDAGRRPFDLAVSPPPDEGGGGQESSAAPEFKKKKKQQKQIVTDTVQPTIVKEAAKPAEIPGTSTGSGSGAGSGSGTGMGSGMGSGTGSGTGSGSGSGSGSAAEEETETFVPPTVLKGLRIAGDTQIGAPDYVKTQMIRDGKKQVTGGFRVCVGKQGEIASLTMSKSTGYPAYDRELMSGVKAWRYKPYLLNGKPLQVCSVVTFIYGLQ
jgi:TonB family protein